MYKCQQNISRDISNNQNTFSTNNDHKSQKPNKGLNGVNNISVAVNTGNLLEKTLSLSEPVAFPPLNLVKSNKTNPSKVDPFITPLHYSGIENGIQWTQWC